MVVSTSFRRRSRSPTIPRRDDTPPREDRGRPRRSARRRAPPTRRWRGRGSRTPHPEVAPRPRNGVDRGFGRQGGVEPGIEHRDLRHVGEPGAGSRRAPQRRPVMQGREIRQLGQIRAHRVRDHHRVAVAGPPWTIRWTIAARVPRATSSSDSTAVAAVVAGRPAELDAGGAGVHHQDVFAAQYGHIHSVMSAGSSPYSRVHARQRSRASTMSCRTWLALEARPGTRSMTSITR